MNRLTSGNPTVDSFGSLGIQGNIIPETWYGHLKLPSGRTDLNAIVILAEIVYWYRPSQIKDEETGKVTWHKKFHADKLQKSYQQLADKFGLTKRQVSDAVHRLVDQGLITTELRDMTVKGLRLTNVMFMEPVYKRVLEITTTLAEGDGAENGDTSPESTGDPPTIERDTPPAQDHTYTETTTETTTEIDNILSFEEIEPQKDVIPYQEIVDYLNLKAGTSYRHSTSSTQKLIRARWNEGFRLDDFKQVIDNMTAKWKGDPKMEQYLRPQTLFGTKFESYLQTTSKTKPKEDDPYDEDDWGFKKV